MMDIEHILDCDIDGHGHGYLGHSKDGCSISELHHEKTQN